MFPIAQAYVDRVVLVGDIAIRQAQEALWASAQIVAEPGEAAPLAALLAGGYGFAPGERVGVVISGGNTTAVDFGGPADSSPGSGMRARAMRAGGPRRVS